MIQGPLNPDITFLGKQKLTVTGSLKKTNMSIVYSKIETSIKG